MNLVVSITSYVAVLVVKVMRVHLVSTYRWKTHYCVSSLQIVWQAIQSGMEEGEAIESKMLSRSIEKAQRKVEGRNFDIRKQLLEYDDVANDQRKVVYELRDELMNVDDISDMIEQNREDVLTAIIDEYIPPQSLEDMWDVEGLQERLKADFDLDAPIKQWRGRRQTVRRSAAREIIS